MEFPQDGGWLRDSAVSLYFLKIPHFTLVEELKVFKKNVWKIYSVPQTLYIRYVIKRSYVQIYTMFFELNIHLF